MDMIRLTPRQVLVFSAGTELRAVVEAVSNWPYTQQACPVLWSWMWRGMVKGRSMNSLCSEQSHCVVLCKVLTLE